MQKIRYCTHQTLNGMDTVQLTTDGKCYCPICKQTWVMEELDKEQVEELVQKLLNQLQIMAWSGAGLATLDPSFNQNMQTTIRFLNAFPDLWESAMRPIAPYEIEEASGKKQKKETVEFAISAVNSGIADEQLMNLMLGYLDDTARIAMESHNDDLKQILIRGYFQVAPKLSMNKTPNYLWLIHNEMHKY